MNPDQPGTGEKSGRSSLNQFGWCNFYSWKQPVFRHLVVDCALASKKETDSVLLQNGNGKCGSVFGAMVQVLVKFLFREEERKGAEAKLAGWIGF